MDDIIDIAVKIEKNGEKIYRDALQKISDPSLISLLQWMADEEVQHADWFSGLKKKALQIRVDSEFEEMGKKILRDAIGEQSFSLHDFDFAGMKGVNDLLAVAIEFEKDTIMFYEMLRTFIDDKDTLQKLDMIIAEEKKHVEMLETFRSGNRH
ncbi:ferritin family protein [Thermodesulfobacteriota bacterium]